MNTQLVQRRLHTSGTEGKHVRFSTFSLEAWNVIASQHVTKYVYSCTSTKVGRRRLFWKWKQLNQRLQGHVPGINTYIVENICCVGNILGALIQGKQGGEQLFSVFFLLSLLEGYFLQPEDH